jgi:hypothetical protein
MRRLVRTARQQDIQLVGAQFWYGFTAAMSCEWRNSRLTLRTTNVHDLDGTLL